MNQTQDPNVKAANRNNLIAALALSLAVGATFYDGFYTRQSNKRTERSVQLAEDSLKLSTKQFEDARQERIDTAVEKYKESRPRVVLHTFPQSFRVDFDRNGKPILKSPHFGMVSNVGKVDTRQVASVWYITDMK
jgi:hypothetical protein